MQGARGKVRSEALFPIEENVARVRERIETAARRVGRKGEEIRLMAVSKTVDIKAIERAIKAGLGSSSVRMI